MKGWVDLTRDCESGVHRELAGGNLTGRSAFDQPSISETRIHVPLRDISIGCSEHIAVHILNIILLNVILCVGGTSCWVCLLDEDKQLLILL